MAIEIRSADSTGYSPAQQRRIAQTESALAIVSLLALAAICGLAFMSSDVVLADRVALLFLAVFALIFWTPVMRLIEAQSGGATFFLTAIMFVLYALARRVVPEDGPALRLAILPDDEFTLPYAAYASIGGAALTSFFWWRYRDEGTRAILTALVAIGILAAFSFWLLARFYPVGATERLDPSSLPPLFMLLVEYGCVAVLCRSVGAHPPTRTFALRILPFLLIALWVRHHFWMPKEDAE